MSGMHHVEGMCEGRSMGTKDDWCNASVVEGSRYCPQCKCSVEGCPENWGTEWPLLDPVVKLCPGHECNPPERYRAWVAAANAPPDDFDIPFWSKLSRHWGRLG